MGRDSYGRPGPATWMGMDLSGSKSDHTAFWTSPAPTTEAPTTTQERSGARRLAVRARTYDPAVYTDPGMHEDELRRLRRGLAEAIVDAAAQINGPVILDKIVETTTRDRYVREFLVTELSTTITPYVAPEPRFYVEVTVDGSATRPWTYEDRWRKPGRTGRLLVGDRVVVSFGYRLAIGTVTKLDAERPAGVPEIKPVLAQVSRELPLADQKPR